MLSHRPAIDPPAVLSQCVLDALPEPVLVLNPATGTLQPANLAGAQLVALVPGNGEGTQFGELFPELNLATLPIAEGGVVLARMNHAVADTTGEVLLRLLPLGNSDRASTPHRVAIFVRAVASVAEAHDRLPRDAFDDSFHDSLTRLPNRRLFHRRLERAIERATHANYGFALLFVDLDGFKAINDQFGHLEGDRLLLVAAHRMVEAVRPQDMVARRDGDEFTILLDDLVRCDDAIHIAQRVIQHLQVPLAIEGAAPVAIGASIGIAMSEHGPLSADDLIARADAAMYGAKKSGGNTFVLADAAPGGDESSDRPFRRLPR